MPFTEMNHEDLQKIITRLDQAIYNHQAWFNSLIRTLICHLPPDQRDIADDAHRQCRFGQWYYSENLNHLSKHPGFKALGEEHERMHQLAKSLLEAVNSGRVVSPPEYDNFSNSLERLSLEITTLIRELENLLYTRDPLTKTINRVNMLTLLREQQESAKRENQRCFLVMMDIDHFKAINDQHGHKIGDNILSVVAHLIAENLQPHDRIFRYGGEEFLISLNNIEANKAFEKIEELRNKIAANDIIKEPTPIRITVSFGISPLDLYAPVEDSIERADKALMAAKSSGRNCTQFWNQEM
ncbi:MAG: diguanylate cyclase [Chlamydiae bacterium CG10_big_fil_rev_8_21_14_0_10_35_9]|nr:MAG: diguanylate cyclase [Chlamydiae bacterium CG10_big_fil_rev_8_21_14_0_10_35_9]